jgi:hemerythrin superfamily protein
MADNPPRGASVDDALSLLTIDHDEVAELFARYQSLADGDASSEARRSLAEDICSQLTVHAAIEEEIFYPALREATGNDEAVDDALEEHQGVKEIIGDIQAGDPTEPRYDEMVATLSELVAAHVHEEESELFPLARDSELDLEELGAQMSARQEALLSAEEDEDAS